MPSTAQISPADLTTENARDKAAYRVKVARPSINSSNDASFLDYILENEHHSMHTDAAWLLRHLEAVIAASPGSAARAALRAVMGGPDGETIGRLAHLQEAVAELARAGGHGPLRHITAWSARVAVCGVCGSAAGAAAPSAVPAEACRPAVRKEELWSARGLHVVPVGNELTTHTLDVEEDLACLVIGRTLVPIVDSRAFRLVFFPVMLLTWSSECLQILLADCDLGQFSWAYPVPLWMDVYRTLAYVCWMPSLVFLYGAMQRRIISRALRQTSTIWIIITTAAFVISHVSYLTFGPLRRSLWLDLPRYMAWTLWFPAVALSDALPGTLRIHVLRWAGVLILTITASICLFLRLPSTPLPGLQLCTVMGVEEVTHYDVELKSSTILTLLLARGVLKAWVKPRQLAFIGGALVAREV